MWTKTRKIYVKGRKTGILDNIEIDNDRLYFSRKPDRRVLSGLWLIKITLYKNVSDASTHSNNVDKTVILQLAKNW